MGQIAPLLPENGRRGRPGRKPGFDAVVCARRNAAERCVVKLKRWWGIAPRHERQAANYRAAVAIAALVI